MEPLPPVTTRLEPSTVREKEASKTARRAGEVKLARFVAVCAAVAGTLNEDHEGVVVQHWLNEDHEGVVCAFSRGVRAGRGGHAQRIQHVLQRAGVDVPGQRLSRNAARGRSACARRRDRWRPR